MTNSKELFERRKHKRFHVQDGAFAVVRPHSTKLGQIIDILGQIMDISRGGLAFRYIASEEPSNGSFKLVRFAHNWNIGMVGTKGNFALCWVQEDFRLFFTSFQYSLAQTGIIGSVD